jgi:hypothetical protein
MGQRLRQLGRNVVLAGYLAVTVSLYRAIVDLYSEPKGSAQFTREIKRVNVGVEIAYIMLILGILTAALFVIWIAKSYIKGAEQFKIAKVATLVFAGQSVLFGLGLMAYVVNELTLDFPHLEHPGFAGFGWEYPLIGGLLLATVGYFMIFRSLNIRTSEALDEVSSEA